VLSVLAVLLTLLIPHREPRENDSLIQQFRAEADAAQVPLKPRVAIIPEARKFWDELSGDLKEEYRVAENESEGNNHSEDEG
jgi:hypothetical protein